MDVLSCLLLVPEVRTLGDERSLAWPSLFEHLRCEEGPPLGCGQECPGQQLLRQQLTAAAAAAAGGRCLV